MDRKKEIMDASLLNNDCSEMEKPLFKNVVKVDGDTCASIAKTNMLIEDKEINWANKYRPKALKDFICHKEKATILRSLVRSEQISHLIIEGPPGVGKRTMAHALLREDIGLDIAEAREEFKFFHLKSAFDEGAIHCIHLKVKISPQHIELNLEDLKGYAPAAVIELFKEIETALMYQQNVQGDHSNDKAIVLYKAEKLPKDTQLGIRSFLETFGGHYKVIFCCTKLFQLQHLSSVCTVIQLLPLSQKEIVEVLGFIAEQEDVELPPQLAQDIAEKSKNCLQQAICSFEANWKTIYPFKDSQLIMTGWEEELAMMAKSIIEEQSLKQLFVIRQKLVTLFENNVSPDFIFRTLVLELKNHSDDRTKRQIETLYDEYTIDNVVSLFDGNTCKISKTKTRNNASEFLKIEEFIAKFMSRYNQYRESS